MLIRYYNGYNILWQRQSLTLHFQALHLAHLLVSFLLETTMFVFPPSAFSIGLLVISSLVMTLKCILKLIKIIKIKTFKCWRKIFCVWVKKKKKRVQIRQSVTFVCTTLYLHGAITNLTEVCKHIVEWNLFETWSFCLSRPQPHSAGISSRACLRAAVWSIHTEDLQHVLLLGTKN